MNNLVELLSISEFGLCDYELSDGKGIMAYLKNGQSPPKQCSEDKLSTIIDWNDFVQLSTSCSTYCCKPPPSSIVEFRNLLSNGDDRVWKTSGMDSDSDSDF